jgi:hypothetical protein
LYIEKEKCIPFDAGLLHKIKRQIIIRIHWNNITYTFESDLDALKKIADGHRHRVKNFDRIFIEKVFLFSLFLHHKLKQK